MCRITGIFSPNHCVDAGILTQMRDTLTHGGPDAAGIWTDGPIGLAHRRLSIIDLTEGGNQPFHWRHYVLVYNGEIYNYQELRQELRALGYSFQTESDTEVLITAFHEWGKEAPKRFHGMFAFAIWDKQQQQLWLCRDRMGVKPLYIYEKEGLLLFSSELKGILAYGMVDRSINLTAVAEYMHYGYIASPKSIYQYVRKMAPGTIECISLSGKNRKTAYWRPQDYYQSQHKSNPEALEEILHRSFRYRMVSDVPVGVFLSGGIDSSLLCAVLARQQAQPIHTFTIGFQEKELDEAPYARAIANYLGTEHKELFCSVADFETLLPDYFQMYDEPFGDSSGIPTYLVSKLARGHVKVALSADGADELFGGYTKYHYTARFIQQYQKYPLKLRQAISRLVQWGIPILSHEWVQTRLGVDNLHNKLVKGSQALSAKDIDAFFRQASGYLSEQTMRSYHLEVLENTKSKVRLLQDKHFGYMGLADIQHYLEGDILCKVDRASMYTALETREPFLDQDLIEYALQLSDAHKYRAGQGKYLLRSILRKHLPDHLFQRPKHGFRVPIGQWLSDKFSDTLRELSQDSEFCQRFGISQTFTQARIRSFLRQPKSVSEYEIWFLFALYQWDATWNRA